MLQNNQPNSTMNYYPYMYNNMTMPQYQRMAPVEQPQMSYQYSTGYHLKGRPVASLDEARAAQIDFDGSLHVFTDIGNKKIYTKQINLDGTASLQTYVLIEEDPSIEPKNELSEYVTKTEFNQALSQLQEMFMRGKEKKSDTLNNF